MSPCAAVGTVAVQGLMLAAGFDVAAPIPAGVQPDWEAGPHCLLILYPRPQCAPTLYPAHARRTLFIVYPCTPAAPPHCAPILYPAHARRTLLLILAIRALAVCS